MSDTYIAGMVRDMVRKRTSAYMPLIEAITNAIDAIEETGRKDGRITLRLIRANQISLDGSTPDIVSIEITDNGIGFNEENRKSFDTIFSPKKESSGGKGFGRFLFLKHFQSVSVESYYKEDDKSFKRTFELGKTYEVIMGEHVEEVPEHDTGTTIRMTTLKEGRLDKQAETIARRLLEQILSYFADDDYHCPRIEIIDPTLDEKRILNDVVGTSNDDEIQLRHSETIDFKDQKFGIKMFKILAPRSQKSQIILTARNQAVTETPLEIFVPEFESDFVEEYKTKDGEKSERNFIVRFYVHGEYLTQNATTERASFNFGKDEDDVLYPITQRAIENRVAEIAKELFSDVFNTRYKRKERLIQEYARKTAPWYAPYLPDIDMEGLKAGLSSDEMEAVLHAAKFKRDQATKKSVEEIIKNSGPEVAETASQLISTIKEASTSELAQYVALRRSVLSLFKKTLELTAEDKYPTEKAVHDIIFPTKSDSDSISYDGHNLWIIDERLNFTEHLSSDKRIFKSQNSDRPDIAAFHHAVAYREGNEAFSPVSIFEFKRPGRDDFADQSSNEDPVQQVIRYANAILNREYKTPKGKQIQISENTPFYGYIIADVSKKVEEWLKKEKDFKPMPDNQGWYMWHSSLNLYIEFITWDKLVKDAELRHRIFFEKLGIEG